jgi:hypothetical protein
MELLRIIFPAFSAIHHLIDCEDAKIVSNKGWEVLTDPEKMKIVNKAVENCNSGIVVVNL